jgi:hypothetical protein
VFFTRLEVLLATACVQNPRTQPWDHQAFA